ncbi:MAG: SusC/RagA family TonB-linked outer membrane protein [Gemmatimonadota bacterium]|nr:SusC/RagA family TonB-linked outer membrane protein [Gemmatimonadota bacterium]
MNNLRRLMVLLGILIMPSGVAAQQGTIRGIVVDATSMRPLAGARVTAVQGSLVPGNLGAITDAVGRFTLANVPAGTYTLRASVIGYNEGTLSVPLAAGTTEEVSLRLVSSVITIEGVVVTALGMERSARTLGVAAQQLNGDQLSVIAPNIVTSLSGQVSGINVTSATTQGGSSRIIIRGENSLLGNNQPLFVIDGVPVDNYSGGAQGVVVNQGGYDYGTLINDIAPGSIESVTVLKGANAAALYGSRASNGVVVIETKKGSSATGGAEVVASQAISFENTLRLPKYQNKYGQGANGLFEYYDGKGNGIYDDVDESWGPALDQGLMIPQFNSRVLGMDADGRTILEPLPWVSRPDNVKDFFETGNTRVTNVSVASATERANGRFSLSRYDQRGITPGFGIGRTTISMAGGVQPNDRLSVNSSVQFITHEAQNRPAQGYDGNNPMNSMGVWFGRQVDTGVLRQLYLTRYADDHPAAGSYVNWQQEYHNNPYFLQLVNHNSDTRNRLIGQISGSYQLLPWLGGMVRTSIDWYQDERIRSWAEGNCCGLYTTNPLTASRDFVQETGAFGDWNLGFQERNTDFLLSANPGMGLPFTTAFTLGGGRRDWERTHNYLWVGRLTTPGIYNISNAAVTPETYIRTSRKAINSLYGQAEFGYNNYLFFNFTGRNDWSSTLPENANSYFYPSISSSFVFTDVIPFLANSDVISHGKLRASWARVGNDTDPYSLRNAYTPGEIWEGTPTFQVPNIRLNEDLRPEVTSSREFGVELGFLRDRLGLDITRYNEVTRDQIFPINISPATGYASQYVNAGSVRNRGWEVLLTGVPVQKNNLHWRTTLTWSKNRSVVEKLADGVSGLEIGIGDFWGASIFAREGEEYGQIIGTAFQRAPVGVPIAGCTETAGTRCVTNGEILTGTTGLPIARLSNQVIGNFNPHWRAGWQNTVSWGNFGFSGLIDTKVGGDIFSATKMFGTFTGVLAETADWGRCVEKSAVPGSSYPVCDAETGVIIDGVQRVVTNGDTTYVRNTRARSGQVVAMNYYYQTAEANIINGSFVKLRELTLSYNLPSSWTRRTGANALQVALIGRNLWLWTPKENPHIDPETASEAGNVQGFEYGQTPPARSIGLTVTVRP